jgi:hypothetical protein
MGPGVRRDDVVAHNTLRTSVGSDFQTALLVATSSRSRGALRPRFAINFPPSKQRAQGMPGARCAHSRAWCVESTRVSHHGHTGKRPAFPAQWFYGLFRALPGDRALLPPSPAKVAFRELDASVGASGPHVFAVRGKHVRQRAAASTASRPNVRDDGQRPSEGRDGGGYRFDLG